jgi:hypothetical protein
MNCCDYDCNQGRNCPARKASPLATPGMGKVGRRYHTASALPPSVWRKSIKPWAALALGVVLGAAVGGVIAVGVFA